MLTVRQKKKLIADYYLLGSYRKAAAKNHVAPNTVKKACESDPEFARECAAEKNACARDILSHMRSQSGVVCTILDNALAVLSDPEKMKDSTPSQIATAVGILIDKWNLIDAGGKAVEVTMEDSLKELAE